MSDKRCFMYCGDDVCNCGAAKELQALITGTPPQITEHINTVQIDIVHKAFHLYADSRTYIFCKANVRVRPGVSWTKFNEGVTCPKCLERLK